MRRLNICTFWRNALLPLCLGLAASAPAATTYQVIGWNDFGIDRLDSDYSVFSLWPPGNTIRAQVAYQGKLLTNATGISVTYQAVADPDLSINSTSAGKTEFWQYVLPLYGTNPPLDVGLGGFPMPNGTNRALVFNSTNAWFTADGIPITPIDDALKPNPYPMMRLILRTNTTALATNDIVLPISDEVNCRVCHASGTDLAAQPSAGWAWNTDPEHDYRLNILRIHDELRNPVSYPGILSSNGYNPAGLYSTVVADNKPVLCVRCHKSTIQPGSGWGTIPPLTVSIHSLHATVTDPDTGITLGNSPDRAACYHCHPGANSHALRGVMGDSIATNGVRAIQCQSCHGGMTNMASANRTGWIDLPDCQSCHSGTATSNNGQIRYTTVFESNGTVRQAVDQTFATVTNTSLGNFSLYRYSTGHSKLFCSACHNSPHAEFPADRNDNIRAIQMQGHTGMISDCGVCHASLVNTENGGPHGIHEIGTNWVSGHIGSSGPACNACHGTDERGTILSLAQRDETLTSALGTKKLWRGFRVGCYLCHQGSGNNARNPIGPAVVANISTNTTSGAAVVMNLTANDTNSPVQTISVRIISQPDKGMVALSNKVATYYAPAGFVGTETFTFAAWNGASDSNLGTGTVAVAQGTFAITSKAQVPASYPAGWTVPFGVVATPSNINATVTYDWDFGDATAHSTNRYSSHKYVLPGSYNWKIVSTVTSGTSKSATNSGTIVVTSPLVLTATAGANSVTLSWPKTAANALLEYSDNIGAGALWSVSTNTVTIGTTAYSVNVPNTNARRFFRLRGI
jgi:hypothetical protein